MFTIASPASACITIRHPPAQSQSHLSSQLTFISSFSLSCFSESVQRVVASCQEKEGQKEGQTAWALSSRRRRVCICTFAQDEGVYLHRTKLQAVQLWISSDQNISCLQVGIRKFYGSQHTFHSTLHCRSAQMISRQDCRSVAGRQFCRSRDIP